MKKYDFSTVENLMIKNDLLNIIEQLNNHHYLIRNFKKKIEIDSVFDFQSKGIVFKYFFLIYQINHGHA